MLHSENIGRVYCFVRGENPIQRLLQSLNRRGLKLTEISRSKITAIAADVSEPDLGLSQSLLKELRQTVSMIVHVT